jgi:hypothetical protein
MVMKLKYPNDLDFPYPRIQYLEIDSNKLGIVTILKSQPRSGVALKIFLQVILKLHAEKKGVGCELGSQHPSQWSYQQ